MKTKNPLPVTRYLLLITSFLLPSLAFAQSPRGKVAGNVLADTVKVGKMMVRNGNANTLVLSDGSTATIGNGLQIVNDSLKRTQTAAIAGKSLVTSQAGTDYTITTSASADTIKLPFASTTANGIINTTNQEFAGIKIFTDTLGVSQYNGILYNTNTTFTNNDFDWKLNLENTAANLNHLGILTNGNNKLYLSPSGKLDYQSSTTSFPVYANWVETTVGLKKTGGGTYDLYRANGTTVRHVFNEGFRFETNGTQTTQQGIGLNTTQPTSLFEINGTGNGGNFIFKVSSASDVAIATNSNATNTYAGISLMRNSDEKWYMGLAPNSNKFIITGTGNVGIGTGAPTEKLEVVGNVMATSLSSPSGVNTILYAADGNKVDIGPGLKVTNGQISGYASNYRIAVNTGTNDILLDNSTDYLVRQVASGVTVKVFLPVAASSNTGKRFTIKSIGLGITAIYIQNYYSNGNVLQEPITFTDPAGASKKGIKVDLTGGILTFISTGSRWYQVL